MLTTHNTANRSNNILRPDSYYVISNGTVKTIAERAGREVVKHRILRNCIEQEVLTNESYFSNC